MGALSNSMGGHRSGAGARVTVWGLTPSQHRRLEDILHQTLGIDALRPFQGEVIGRLLNGRSVLAVVSTGAGKSLCYQLPSLLWEQPVLVVSPLVALMHHQAERMTALGVAARALTGQLDGDAQRQILQQWQAGDLRLMYAAPERLSDNRLQSALKRVPPRLLVVDEAHCISEWGYDFRPEYRRIRAFRESIGNPLLLALTATATHRVKADIRWHLTVDGEPFELIAGSIDRPNLYLSVEMAAGPKEQRERVADLASTADGGVIVYVGSRRGAERWAGHLEEALGEPVRAYHAGLDPGSRRQIERAFVDREIRVVAATTAFGMGIDRGDIRAVIHVGVPESLDAYYQEIGRAGRDGKSAEAAMVIQAVDLYRRERWIRQDRPDRTWASALIGRIGAQPSNRPVVWEMEESDTRTPVLLSVLEDMGAVEVKGSPAGMRVMRLSDVDAYAEAVLDRLDQFWQRRDRLFQQMAAYIETERCRRSLILAYYGQSEAGAHDRCCDQCATRGQATVAPRPHAPLVDRLRAWRADEAARSAVEPYIVLSDRDLMGIAVKRPQTVDALARCRGMGPKRMQKYGAELLAIMTQHGAPIQDMPEEAYDPSAPRDRAVWHFRAGTPWERIRQEVGRSESTLRGYFVDWLTDAPKAEWRHYLSRWFSVEDYRRMAALLKELGPGRLRPLYEAAEGEFRYDQWEVARAVWSREPDGAEPVTESGRPTLPDRFPG